MPLAGLAPWALSGGGVTFVTSGEKAWRFTIQPRIFLFVSLELGTFSGMESHIC